MDSRSYLKKPIPSYRTLNSYYYTLRTIRAMTYLTPNSSKRLRGFIENVFEWFDTTRGLNAMISSQF